MKTHVLLWLSGLLLTHFAMGSITAAQSQLEQITERMQKADGAGRFVDSERYAREIVSIAKQRNNPKVLIVGYFYLGRALGRDESTKRSKFLCLIQIADCVCSIYTPRD